MENDMNDGIQIFRKSPLSASLDEASATSHAITERLGQATSKIDDTGKAFSDSAPLQNIEKSITGIKGDITEIDIQIGVVSNTLLHLKRGERTKQIEDGKPIDLLDEAHK
jgi:hypothetical protein